MSLSAEFRATAAPHDTSAQPRVSASALVRLDVELAVLTIHQGRLSVLAVRRLGDDGGRWCLPSRPVGATQDADAVAEQLLAAFGASPVTADPLSASNSPGSSEEPLLSSPEPRLRSPEPFSGNPESASGSLGPEPASGNPGPESRTGERQLRPTMFMEQLRTYSSPTRRPERAVAVAYVALVADLGTIIAKKLRSLAPEIGDTARLFAVDDVMGAAMLAFDHDAILSDAIERVRAKLEYTTIATSLVVEPFTIPELRRVYEAVWGVSLHQANFRRKVLATPAFVVPDLVATQPSIMREPVQSERRVPDGERRGPEMYRRGTSALLHPAMLRPNDPS
jgi:8-oxo-dGTP diphosphatase